MDNVLCEQEAPSHRNQTYRVREARFSSCDSVQEAKVVLSCVLNRSPEKLPIMPSTPEAQSFRKAT